MDTTTTTTTSITSAPASSILNTTFDCNSDGDNAVVVAATTPECSKPVVSITGISPLGKESNTTMNDSVNTLDITPRQADIKPDAIVGDNSCLTPIGAAGSAAASCNSVNSASSVNSAGSVTNGGGGGGGNNTLKKRVSSSRTPAAKARRIRFYRNGDRFYAGIVIAVSTERYRSFESLVEDLTRLMEDRVAGAVRNIHTTAGKRIATLDDIEDGTDYVCLCNKEAFKKLDYSPSAGQPASLSSSSTSALAANKQANRLSRHIRSGSPHVNGNAAAATTTTSNSSSGSSGNSNSNNGMVGSTAAAPPNGCSSPAMYTNGNSTAIPTSAVSTTPVTSEAQQCVHPRIVTLIRNGTKPRRVHRLLLNKRNSPSFDHVLTAITACVKLDSGCVRKVFTLDGTPVQQLAAFFGTADVFFAYGTERVQADDWRLDADEQKAVANTRRTVGGSAQRANGARRLDGPKPRMPVKNSVNLHNATYDAGDIEAVLKKTTATAKTTTTKATDRKPQQQQKQTQKKSTQHRPDVTGTSGPVAVAVGDDALQYDDDDGDDDLIDEPVDFEGGDGDVEVGVGGFSGAAAIDPAALPERIRADYALGPIVGDGNFAVVLRMQDRRTGRAAALKIIDKSKCKGKEHYIDAEVRVMKKLSHPNIMALLMDVDTVENMFLVLEYVSGGDLFDAITAATRFSEPHARLMIQHLASAMSYLHNLGIVHRDIKPENLLVELDPLTGQVTELKLADFGLACEVSQPLLAVCGTPTYVAPEILLETGYGLKIDVWAAGIILYILLCGFPPFVSADNQQEPLFDAILSGVYEFPEPYWTGIGDDVRDLIANMLQSDPELRFSSEDVLDHVWTLGGSQSATNGSDSDEALLAASAGRLALFS